MDIPSKQRRITLCTLLRTRQIFLHPCEFFAHPTRTQVLDRVRQLHSYHHVTMKKFSSVLAKHHFREFTGLFCTKPDLLVKGVMLINFMFVSLTLLSFLPYFEDGHLKYLAYLDFFENFKWMERSPKLHKKIFVEKGIYFEFWKISKHLENKYFGKGEDDINYFWEYKVMLWKRRKELNEISPSEHAFFAGMDEKRWRNMVNCTVVKDAN